MVKEEVKDDEDSSDLDVTDDEETIETKRKKNELKTWRSQEVNFEQGTVYIEKFKGSPLSIDISIFK